MSPITVDYTNYRGERSVRQVVPNGLPFFASTKWHPEPQWLLPVLDVTTDSQGIPRNQQRDFAMKDCNFIVEKAK